MSLGIPTNMLRSAVVWVVGFILALCLASMPAHNLEDTYEWFSEQTDSEKRTSTFQF